MGEKFTYRRPLSSDTIMDLPVYTHDTQDRFIYST